MVYLLHLNTPLAHAKHYIGWSENGHTLTARLANHAAGKGSRFTQVCCERGITWTLAKIWKGKGTDKSFERKLKNRHDAQRICPICQKEKHEKAKQL